MLYIGTIGPVFAVEQSIEVHTQVDKDIKSMLNEFLRNEENLNGAIAGISIRSANSGEILFSHYGDTRLRPASNLKLLTAAAALSVLGEDYRFSTELWTDGTINNGVLNRNLYLKGKGDPTLLKEDLDEIARLLHKTGVREVKGDVIGDDSWYDDLRLSQDLPWTDEHTYYGAQISALTVSPNDDFDAGTVIVSINPAKNAGEKATITVDPETDYVNIINKTETVTKTNVEELKIERKHGTNTIVVEGEIPINSNMEREWIAVWEPTDYVLNLFKHSLEKHGIQWSGNFKRGVTPSDAKKLINHESIPLAELLIPFMKLSNNGHAEVLVKEMGRVKKGEGSWEKGLEVMTEELSKLGVNVDTLVLRDGSGISHVNLIPANEISNFLYTVQNKEWFPTFLDSLPVAGITDRLVGGSLRHRMYIPPMQGNVKAKTGTISTVSSLSGYIDVPNEEKIIFSILLNNVLDEDDGKDIEDKIISLLVQGFTNRQ